MNGTLRTGLLTENGARFIVSDLVAGSASVFPMVGQLGFGSIVIAADLDLLGSNPLRDEHWLWRVYLQEWIPFSCSSGML